MPTSLDRIQVLCQPDLYAQIQTLAKHFRTSKSHICAQLIDQAIKAFYGPHLEKAETKVNAKQHPGTTTRPAQFLSNDLDEAIAALSVVLEKAREARDLELKDRGIFDDDFVVE